MLSKQVAIGIFALVAIAVIVLGYIYINGPYTRTGPHQLYVRLVNATPDSQDVQIEGKTITIASEMQTSLTVKSNAVVRSDTLNATVTLTDGVNTIYLLRYGFATNLTSIEIPFYNRTNNVVMFIDASGPLFQPRMAKEILTPNSRSQFKHIVSNGSEWQVVNPMRNDVNLASLRITFIDKNATGLVFDGSSLKLETRA